MKEFLFFDEESEILYNEIPSSHLSKIKLSLSVDFDIGQSYVTSKIEDRRGNIRNMNIQGGRRGIQLQTDLFNIKNFGNDMPSHVYVKTMLKDFRLLVRKLPITGTSDWLLLFDDDLFVQAVKGMYDEIEILG